MAMKLVKIKPVNEHEHRALAWARSAYGPKMRARLLQEGRFEMGKTCLGKPILSHAIWEHKPFGHASMNRDFQFARLAVRRATYFSDLPCYKNAARPQS